MKLKEDWCGTTQDSWLEKVILHGLNIIVSVIWENIVYVIWLEASYAEAKGRFVWNHSGWPVGGYSAWFKPFQIRQEKGSAWEGLD